VVPVVDVVLAVAKLLLALFLVLLNGFFVASEFAFVRVRSTAVDQLAAEGRAGSQTLLEVMNNLDDYLAATQLGITVASLGLGWAGEPAVAALLEVAFESVLPANLLHIISFAIAFSLVTFLHVVFGELAPKTVAIAQAERLSLFVAPPMKAFYLIFYPGLVIFNGAANGFTRMLGIPPASETEETLGEEELRRTLANSGEKGHVDMEKVEMIERVFELDETLVQEVMVPRPDVVSLPADASLSEIRSVVLEAQHTRYPVVDADDEDQVVGFIDVKDVLSATESDGEAVTAAELAREILVVPETTTANDLLLQFRDEKQQMAAIIDEWGALEGIATVEDVVEGVVGDLQDEFDKTDDEPAIHQQESGEYTIDGGVPLAVVRETLTVDLESEEFNTVGGMVLERLDRAPEPGDEITADGYVFVVDRVDGTRISKITAREQDVDGQTET
jgi:CBS domain containing-hemolysin-like protein